MFNSYPKIRQQPGNETGPSGRNWEFGIEDWSDLTQWFPERLIIFSFHPSFYCCSAIVVNKDLFVAFAFTRHHGRSDLA